MWGELVKTTFSLDKTLFSMEGIDKTHISDKSVNMPSMWKTDEYQKDNNKKCTRKVNGIYTIQILHKPSIEGTTERVQRPNRCIEFEVISE